MAKKKKKNSKLKDTMYDWYSKYVFDKPLSFDEARIPIWKRNLCSETKSHEILNKINGVKMEKKKFKLLKDLPGIKAGRIIEIDNLGYGMRSIATDDGKFNGSYNWTNKDWFEEVKEEFKVGDWVVILQSGGGVNNSYIEKVVRLEAITADTEYQSHERKFAISCPDDSPTHRCISTGLTFEKEPFVRLATKEEIETHLIAEAKKRGYKGGIKIIGLTFGGVHTLTDEFDGYDTNEDALFMWIDDERYSTASVYKRGVWAKIIEDKPTKIAGYDVEVNDYTVSIGCKQINKNNYNIFLDILETLAIDLVNCSLYDAPHINTTKLFDIVGRTRRFRAS